MPAEQEEIIVRVDAVDVQKSGNDGYQFLFGTREARRNRLVLKGICGIGRGQGGAIYFAISGERKSFQYNKHAGDHVIGQMCLQVLTQITSVDLSVLFQDEIGSEKRVCRRIFARDDDAGLNGVMLA